MKSCYFLFMLFLMPLLSAETYIELQYPQTPAVETPTTLFTRAKNLRAFVRDIACHKQTGCLPVAVKLNNDFLSMDDVNTKIKNEIIFIEKCIKNNEPLYCKKLVLLAVGIVSWASLLGGIFCISREKVVIPLTIFWAGCMIVDRLSHWQQAYLKHYGKLRKLELELGNLSDITLVQPKS